MGTVYSKMATSCEPHGVVLADANFCAVCQCRSRDRYLLLSKYGLRKPLLDDLEAIMSMTLSGNIKNDSYVCRPCRRKIGSYKAHMLAAAKIKNDLLSSAGSVEIVQNMKRRRSLECDGGPKSPITPKRCKMTTPTSKTPPQSPRRKLYSSPGLTRTSPKKMKLNSNSIGGGKSTSMAIKFYTTSIANETRDIISSLCNGSIRKATRKLLSKESLQPQSTKGLADAVRIESKKVTRLNEMRCGDLNFKTDVALEEIKKSLPLLWTTLSSVCPTDTPLSKVLMAAGILVQAKNRYINGLQLLIGKLMYQSQLQKAGYSFLYHLGITTSYKTVMNHLHAMATEVVDDQAMSWEHDLEINNTMDQSDTGTSAGEELQPTGNLDHTYAMSPQCDSVSDCDDEEPGFRFNMDNLDYEYEDSSQICLQPNEPGSANY